MSNSSIGFKFNKIKTRHLIALFFIIIASVFISIPTFAESYTLCNGREFNRRVKAFLNNGDENIKSNWDITVFEKGISPPTDPAYYVDVSEDNDGSVIVYRAIDDIFRFEHYDMYDKYDKFKWHLYWYSDGNVKMNTDTAFMFDKFLGIKRIDLSGFEYIKGLNDTRYMFLECRNLSDLKIKSDNSKQPIVPVEVQGMFYGCQSLTSIDLKLFDTHLVDNMDEMFCKCYNLKNVYVDKNLWNISSVRTFTRMFTDCMLLRTNKGRKAVDVAEDDYEQFAKPGDDDVEGFCKDINTSYSDYGEGAGYVPIDGRSYIAENPESIAYYDEEPEGDGSGTNGESGSGTGSGNAPYVGNSSTGYSPTKEKLETPSASGIITPTGAIANQSQDASQSASSVDVSITDVKVESSIEPSSEASAESSIVEAESTGEITESSGKRVIELDEYLKEQGLEGDDGSGKGKGIFDDYKFLLLALGIATIVILLLVGMVLYLFKDKHEGKS